MSHTKNNYKHRSLLGRTGGAIVMAFLLALGGCKEASSTLSDADVAMMDMDATLDASVADSGDLGVDVGSDTGNNGGADASVCTSDIDVVTGVTAVDGTNTYGVKFDFYAHSVKIENTTANIVTITNFAQFISYTCGEYEAIDCNNGNLWDPAPGKPARGDFNGSLILNPGTFVSLYDTTLGSNITADIDFCP